MGGLSGEKVPTEFNDFPDFRFEKPSAACADGGLGFSYCVFRQVGEIQK
jgi:hypothetical protein